LTAALALAALVVAPAAASAVSVTVTGDDGNAVALTPGAPVSIRYLNPTVSFTPSNERYSFTVIGPGGQEAAAGSGSCITSAATNQVRYQGNGAYTVRVNKYAASGSCTTPQSTTDYPFTINGGIGLSGPPTAVLTRNPGKLFRNTLTLPVNLNPGAISNKLFYGHNSPVNPDNSLAAPAGQVYANATAGTVDVPLDKGPGTYQLAGQAEGFNTPTDVFTPWAPVVQWRAFAPFDVKKLSFPDSRGPSYRIRATFNEVTVTGRVSIALARGTKGGKYRSLGSVKVSKHSVTKRFRATKAGVYRLRFKYKGNANVAGGYEVDKIRITRRISFRGASAASVR
jgi:hypothetical protein